VHADREAVLQAPAFATGAHEVVRGPQHPAPVQHNSDVVVRELIVCRTDDCSAA
jgi:hypothetical protein